MAHRKYFYRFIEIVQGYIKFYFYKSWVSEINFTFIQIYGILRIKVFTEAKKNQLQEKTFVDETVSQ
jgi:hypothetical protein